MNGLMKRLSAVAMAVGMLMTIIFSTFYRQNLSLQMPQNQKHLMQKKRCTFGMERQMSVGMMMKKQSSIFLRQSNLAGMAAIEY